MVETSQNNPNPNPQKPTPNFIFGQISSLIYQEGDNNLVEVKIISNNSEFTLTAYLNVSRDYKTISINNFDKFQFRLQEAFNYGFFVRIFLDSDKIISIELTKQSFQSPFFNSPQPPRNYKPRCPSWCECE